VRLLVRTWNLFHGNTDPPERREYLEQMVRLASGDRPAVLCLQELPAWSLRWLGQWSGMTAVADIAARPKLPPALGRRITELNRGLFRSAFTGQANALLLDRTLVVGEHRVLVLNPLGYRRSQARRLGLGPLERLAWAKERRICQVVRVRGSDGGTLVAANLHATGHVDKRIPDVELLRAAAFVDGFARPSEPVLLCGDFNVSPRNSRVLPTLLGPEWGFDGATPARIDHVLSRGVALGPPAAWPEDRRTLDGRLLSDHAPVERRDA
jgi:endonuclease/exonuclease/phosphatase family metal-dependent hydrolase